MTHPRIQASLTIALALLAVACTAAAPPHPLATAPKPPASPRTILIVHGAWGGGWAFRQVDALLSADGYKVFRPTLTGQGERAHLASPTVGLDTHIQDIVNVILFEDLHHLTLVGHSYGGMVITGVANRLPDRIDHLVYVDALLPTDGESLNSAFDHATHGRNGLQTGRPDPDGFLYPTWLKPNTPFPHDVPQSLKTFSDPLHLTHQAATEKIPTLYILTVDKGQPPEQDRFYPFYQRAQERHIPVEIMEGDHNVQWSHPHELAKLLEQAAQ